MAALASLYNTVLAEPLGWLDDVVRAKTLRRVPVVLTRSEVRVVLDALSGTKRLLASLLYGAGLRLRECLQLRVKDIHVAMHQIVVRGGKGDRDHHTMLRT